MKKGAIAERIVREHLESKGFVVYEPVTDKAHPFDKLCSTSDKRTLMVAEIKAKPARRFFPDTGINVTLWREYQAVATRHSLEVFLYFVDEDMAAIYGNTLSALEEKRVVEDGKRTLAYPLVDHDIVYFPLAAMKLVAHLTDEQTKALSGLSTRDDRYALLNGAKRREVPK